MEDKVKKESKFEFIPVNKEQKVDEKTGEVQMSDKEKAQSELDVLKLQRESEAIKLGFKDFKEFESNKQKIEDKLIELEKREDTVKTREELVTRRESDVTRAAEINESVKQNLISKEIQDYKKAEKVRAYAFQNYFNTLDLLRQKITNAKSGVECLGLIKRKVNVKGKMVDKLVEETVCIDSDFRDELIPIFDSIWTVLKKSPKLNKSTGEYLTDEETQGLDEEEDYSDGEEENTNI